MEPGPLPLSVPEEYAANQAFLRRLARGLVRDETRAEDVVQEAWARWFERPPGAAAPARAWLARVLHNVAINLRRGEARRVERELQVARRDAAAPTAGVDEELETQALVLEALRGLDEPFRETLVLRYHHDLGPVEIAARQGVSRETVKARLARGLELLRVALDRRSRGDRRAWSRALASLARRGTAAGARTKALAAVLAGALAVGGAALALWWPRGPRDGAAAAPSLAHAQADAPGDARALLELAPEQRDAVAPAAESRAEPAPPTPQGFDWPQYAGGPAHDNLRARASRIRAPRILWHVPAARGQPTLRGSDLYSGGAGLLRIDPETGEVLASVLAAWEWKEGELEAERLERMALEERAAFPDGRAPARPTIADAPAIGAEVVIARRLQGGGVSAFDRALGREVWSFVPPPGLGFAGLFPGALADGLYVLSLGTEITALREADGSPAWRFVLPGEDRVDMIPAVHAGHVFIGSEQGFLFALDLQTGAEVWSRQSDGTFGHTHPVVVGGHVVLGDRGPVRSGNDERLDRADRERAELARRGGAVLAFDADDGTPLWKTIFGATGFSTPGVGPGYLVAGYGSVVARFDLETGAIDEERVVRTGRNAFGSPTVVGDELVFGNLDGHLYVHDLATGALRWAFRVPDGQVHEFVHTGERIYASTTRGLYALGNDPERSQPLPAGFVLEAP